jgi:hypothetical protein
MSPTPTRAKVIHEALRAMHFRPTVNDFIDQVCVYPTKAGQIRTRLEASHDVSAATSTNSTSRQVPPVLSRPS